MIRILAILLATSALAACATLDADEITIEEAGSPGEGSPGEGSPGIIHTKDDCMDGGWVDLGYINQGLCVADANNG